MYQYLYNQDMDDEEIQEKIDKFERDRKKEGKLENEAMGVYKRHIDIKEHCIDYLNECGTDCIDMEYVENCNYIISQNKNYELIIRKEEEILRELSTALTWISFRPIIYDEIEHFQTGVSYPFNARKSSMPPVIAT